jgi:hypothetical protein
MNLKFELLNHGFEIHAQACPPELLALLRQEFAETGDVEEGLLDRFPALAGGLQELAARLIGPDYLPTQASLRSASDRSEAWRQEPVEEAILLRLSLDPCTFFDGALKLCPSSHKHGVLTANEIRGHSIRPFSSPEMAAGDILLMHPLTIHARAANTSGKPSRVIQLTYSAKRSSG